MNDTDHDVLLLLRRDVKALLDHLKTLLKAMHDLNERLTRVEQGCVVQCERNAHERQDITVARLCADDVGRKVGDVRTELRDFIVAYELAQATITAQFNVIRWILGVVGSVVLAVVIAFLTSLVQ